MRYASFEIKNFKGIKSAKIVLPKDESTAVALIGLNESGKTTILQAIYSFSPNDESKVLFEKDKVPSTPDIEIIPRDKISSFTGDVVVKATIEIEPDDRKAIQGFARSKGFEVDLTAIANTFAIENVNSYIDGEHSKYQALWTIKLMTKTGKQRKFQSRTTDQWKLLYPFIRSLLPDIAYFPTFVFELPEKIYLSGYDRDPRNFFYKQIISDILDYQGDGLTIDKSILSRIHTPDFLKSFAEFLLSFWGSSSQQRIAHAMDLASHTLTEVIISSWHDIFDEKINNKRIELEWKPENNPDGTNQHTIYLKFIVREGTDTYSIADRSLGFRWFFCFLLFTQFRSHRKGGQGTLFLFDEPASNLHAKAQERLLKSFADISKGPNSLIYSTHSQYMINPKWIDFSYIIENKQIDHEKSTDIRAITSNKSDIRAVRYQTFVNDNPGKTSYYQPVLDRLEVKPSLLELKDGAVLVEGKSDFYIIRYMAECLKIPVIIIPAFGSTTFSTLIPLLMGLAKQFFILLDSDKAGKMAREKYADFDLSDSQFIDFEAITGVKEPEYMLAHEDLNIISGQIGIQKRPNKKQIMRFFREALSSDRQFAFSEEFTSRARTLLEAIRVRG